MQNGVWSNSVGFTVPAPDGSTVTLTPYMLNLVVGDARTIQALSSAGQPVTGLTWTSSDPTVVSLSTDDPPVLSALAAGHVTITAGTATADVTVSAGALPLGTVLWSNPGGGSGVSSIVPAVPSPNGVADVFAFQYDGTVQAITSDCTTAWTADVSTAWPVLPDFQGGLVALDYSYSNATQSIVRFDGITGQSNVLLTSDENSGGGLSSLAVHPDGTIFAILHSGAQESVIGLDPTTGAQKFSVPLADMYALGLIIAGDGYAYVPGAYRELSGNGHALNHLLLLRVNSSGASDSAPIFDWTSGYGDFISLLGVNLITNADTGILLTWAASGADYYDNGSGYQVYMTTTTGTSPGGIITPALPGNPGALVPVLQAQDGSFVGTITDMYTVDSSMIAFDQSGSVRWSVAGNYQPKIAAADGGIIATLDDGSVTTFAQSGYATGQMASLPIQSWTGNSYRYGSIDQVVANPYFLAAGFWELDGGQYTKGTAGIPIDSIANAKVRKILTPTRWQNFGKSNCNALFKDPNGIPLYDVTLRAVQARQEELNFYDVGDPGIGILKISAVTAGPNMIPNPITLTNYLNNIHAAAAVPLLGKPGPVVLQNGLLSQQYPQFTLVHEVLLHAYAGQSDGMVLNNAFFQTKGLWNDGQGSTTISTWMSTDCTCTPGQPGTAKCQANTAKW